MHPSYVSLPTLEKLRLHVHRTLCAREKLDPASTPLQETRKVRGGKPCGLFFQVQGPRLLRTHAIWASDENRILFYDSAGLRFAETRLTESPDQELAA
jgi:hypothetical protein